MDAQRTVEHLRQAIAAIENGDSTTARLEIDDALNQINDKCQDEILDNDESLLRRIQRHRGWMQYSRKGFGQLPTERETQGNKNN